MRSWNESYGREFSFCSAQMATWSPFGDCEGKTRCNSAATLGAELTDALLRVQISERSVSCPSLNANLSEDVGLHKEGCFLEKFLDGQNADVGSTTSFPQVVCTCRESALDRDYAASPSCHSVPIRQEGWNVFSTSVPVCSFAPGQSSIDQGHGGRKRVGSWSKRRKQISHVFLRGLWRWKEGVHARKRRRRSAVGCSCSGSGARSCYASDPPTGRARSVTGTDSSGELFFGGKPSSLVSWGADFSSTAMDGGFVRESAAGGDYLTCWRGSQSDAQSTESGYASEPDYSADCEFKWKGDFPADEEEDEEEKEPLHLVVWKEMIASNDTGAPKKAQVKQDCVVELFYGKEPRIRRLHSRIRQKRRPWRTIELCKSRPVWHHDMQRQELQEGHESCPS